MHCCGSYGVDHAEDATIGPKGNFLTQQPRCGIYFEQLAEIKIWSGLNSIYQFGSRWRMFRPFKFAVQFTAYAKGNAGAKI